MEKGEKRYCPDCQNGVLLLTKDDNCQDVYKCNSCSYTNHNIMSVDMGFRCPKCGDYLVLKRGRTLLRKFLSCHRTTCDYRREGVKHSIAPDNKNK